MDQHSYFYLNTWMTTRIQYNSPKAISSILKKQRPGTHKPSQSDETVDSDFRNPEHFKPFQRKPIKFGDNPAKFKPRQSIKDGNISFKRVESYATSPVFQSFVNEKIIKTCSNRQKRSDTQMVRSYDPFENARPINEQNARFARNKQKKIDNKNDQLKVLKEINESLLKKNKAVTNQNSDLKKTIMDLTLKVDSLNGKIVSLNKNIAVSDEIEKKNMNEIRELTIINHNLQKIVAELNLKIEALVMESQEISQNVSELQCENDQLKQTIFSLQKQNSYSQIEISMLKREKNDGEKDKKQIEKLEQRNRLLLKKIVQLEKSKKLNRVKSVDKIDLDYSISFDFPQSGKRR